MKRGYEGLFEGIVIAPTTSGTADFGTWQMQELSHSNLDLIPEAEIVDPLVSEEPQHVHLRGRTLRVINGQLFFVDRDSPGIPTP